MLVDIVKIVIKSGKKNKSDEKLRAIKKRSPDKPFAVLVSRKDAIDDLGYNIDRSAYKLIDEFWPGPLTIIIPGKDNIKTIGIRMPNNTVALSLLKEAGLSVGVLCQLKERWRWVNLPRIFWRKKSTKRSMIFTARSATS